MTTQNMNTKGMVIVNSLNDLNFPVKKVKFSDLFKNLTFTEETFKSMECASDYEFDIYAFPYKKIIQRKIEKIEQLAIDCVSLLKVCEGLQVIDTQAIEGDSFEDIEVVDYSRPIRVNSCSGRYQLVPNSEIFPAIEQILRENNITFTAKYTMYGFARFYVEYIIEDQKFAYPVGKGDFVKPVIKIRHSYNGLVKYQIVVGYFRLVCTNGLTIAIEDMKQFNLSIVGKHTVKINESLNQLQGILQMFANNGEVLKTITNKYNILNSVVVTDIKKAIETTLKNTGIIAVDNKSLNTIDSIYDTITKELNMPTLEYNRTTNWLLYNGINSYLYNDNLNIASPDKRDAKDQDVFEYLLKLSQTEVNKAVLALH
jgi:hypothetical protein